MRRFLCSLLLFVLACSSASAAEINYVAEPPAFTGETAPYLHIVFFSLGAADSILIRIGEDVLLVDAGPLTQDEGIVDDLKKEGVSQIDTLLATHSHSDHVGGMVSVLENFPVGRLVSAFPSRSTSVHSLAMRHAREKNVTVEDWAKDMDFGLSGVEILTCRYTRSTINNQSIVLHLRYGETSLLLPADIESLGQRKLVEKHGEEIQADVLKSPHHGIAPLALEFINAVQPKLIVMTNYSGNQTASFRAQLEKLLPQSPILSTPEGAVHLYSDGIAWYVFQEGANQQGVSENP